MGQVVRFRDPTEIGRRWTMQHKQSGYGTVRAGAEAVGLSKSLYGRLLNGQVRAVGWDNFLTIALALRLATRRGDLIVPEFFSWEKLIEGRRPAESAAESPGHDLDFWEALWADGKCRRLIERFTRDVLFSGYSEERLFVALDSISDRLRRGGDEARGPKELARAGRLGAYLSRAFANERALLRIRRGLAARERQLGKSFRELGKLLSENVRSPIA